MQRTLSRLAAAVFGMLALSGGLVHAQIAQPIPPLHVCVVAPNLRTWLTLSPNVANAIKWQVGYNGSAYHVDDIGKRTWSQWTYAEQQELVNAFEDSWYWYCDPNRWDNLKQGIAYPFTNVNPSVSMDDISASVWIDATVARKLYIAWVAQNLVQELGHHFPWSIRFESAERLQILFDSAAIMTMVTTGQYSVGSGNPTNANYVLRADNLGSSLIGLPRFTYAFLATNNLIGTTRKETIGRVLAWLTANAVHFYGDQTYANMEDHWQYRGIPPIHRIVRGTTYSGTGEFAHWTAGCHGTAGFLRDVLRAANIPVQIVRACGHHQPYFITEGLYLDHGDNPYNLDFKASGLDPLLLLIDNAQYQAWFGSDPDNHENGCENIGGMVGVLTNP
jgi:hypothetical protein